MSAIAAPTEEGAVLLDPEAAARRLGLARQTLARWRCEGRGPRFYKLGRAVRYGLRELEEFESASLLASTSARAAQGEAP